MSRPLKKRKIPRGIEGTVFKPRSGASPRLSQTNLTLDGLEALRLADLQGLYHEEAARRMGVSRATFSRVLSGARSAVADALVNRKALEIDGGAVEHRRRGEWPCPVHEGDRRRGRGCHCVGEKEIP